MSVIEWWMRGQIGEQLCDCADHRIYDQENPDWSGLEDDAVRLGLSYSEAYEFLRSVREEG